MRVKRAYRGSELVWQHLCPSCGSTWTACMVGGQWDVCLDCMRIWERLPTGEPHTRDGELMPFAKPCDNCAFRQGSRERRDVDGWNTLLESLRQGGQFFCHKGVALKLPLLEMKAALDRGEHDSKNAFDFPLVTRQVDLAGECHPYDKDKMRLCRGFLASIWGPQFTKFKKESSDATVESIEPAGTDRRECADEDRAPRG